MEYKIPVTDETYYRVILGILNFSLKLSDFEIEIVSTMLANNWLEINQDTKEGLRKALDKDKFITNNYIKRLKDKNILIPKDDSKESTRGLYDLNPDIINIVKEPRILFEFERHD